MDNIHRTTISLVEKTYITPNYLRAIFHCEDIAPFADVPVGVNNKIFLPSNDDNAATAQQAQATENALAMRTYTHREIDLENRLMTMDFAIHEGDSIACRWAVNANQGDTIDVAMKLQHRPLVPEAEHYLFVTDMSGIAPTAAIVERLPKGVKATIITEVISEADLHTFYKSDADLDLHWYINPTPEAGSDLMAFVTNLPIIDSITDQRYAHIVAEFTTVRTLRGYLHRQKNWGRDEIYACAYWQIGKVESEPREKRIES